VLANKLTKLEEEVKKYKSSSTYKNKQNAKSLKTKKYVYGSEDE